MVEVVDVKVHEDVRNRSEQQLRASGGRGVQNFQIFQRGEIRTGEVQQVPLVWPEVERAKATEVRNRAQRRVVAAEAFDEDRFKRWEVGWKDEGREFRACPRFEQGEADQGGQAGGGSGRRVGWEDRYGFEGEKS